MAKPKAKVKMRYVKQYKKTKQGSLLAGVWIHGPMMETDLSFSFKPQFEEEEKRANDLLNKILSKPKLYIDEDILEQIVKQGTETDYFYRIESTDKYGSWRELEQHVMNA